MRRTTLITTAIAALALGACGTADEAGPGQTQPTSTATAATDGADATPTPDEATSPDATASPDDATSPADDASPEDVSAMTFTECEAERYTVGYPEDWNTNTTDGLLGPCEIFHPGEIDEPEEPRDRDLHYAASMYVDEVEFEERRDSDNPNEVIEERETTVDGRQALVVEFRSTGDALVPEGERSYSYTVDLDGQILVAVTYSVGDTDYERDKQVLDRMVTEELTVNDG